MHFFEPYGYFVTHEWNREKNVFFTFDRTKAEEYAMTRHGSVESAYRRVAVPETNEVENAEQTT